MKKIIVLFVRLKDFENFSFLPGAKEFQAKYHEFEREHSYYAFDLEGDACGQAERDLQASGLSYEKSYELVLDDNEILNHPVHYLIVPSLYNLVTGKKREPTISSEVADFPIAQDFASESVVARVELLDELIRLNPKMKAAHDTIFTIKKKKYRILAELPQLQAPMLMLGGTAVTENEGEFRGTYDIEGWDGRSSLSQDAVDFVKAEHLVAARLFEFQNRHYRQNSSNYLISGQFADFLHKKFQALQIIPMTFGFV